MEVTLVLASLPLLLWFIWSWNELRFLIPLTLGRKNGAKIPPGHMGLPFIGELFSFLWYFKVTKRPDDFIKTKIREYGEGVGLYRSHLFGSPTIITCTPVINNFVYRSSNLFDMAWPTPELMGCTSLVVVNGPPHQRVRSFVINAVNHPQALKQIALTVQARIIAALRQWAQKGIVVAFDEAKKVTFENICKMFSSYEPGALLDEIDQCIQGVLAGIRSQPLDISGTAYHHALKCRRRLTQVFKSELEKRKQRRGISETHERHDMMEGLMKIKDEQGKQLSDEEVVDNIMTHERHDLMEGLMKIKDEQGKQLSDEEVVDNIISLITAGYQSTALSTMWVLYYLAKYPDVLQLLQEEQKMIFEQKEEEFLSVKDISKMKYTAMVVEETLRLANIAPFVFRRAKEDVNYKGYRIPKDWQVVIWFRHLHTDPNNFDNPLSFNPDRWNNSAKPGTYQVFGAGPRICAGNMLVRMQLSIFLHHLTLGYKWKLLNPDAGISYLPHPKPVDGAKLEFQNL